MPKNIFFTQKIKKYQGKYVAVAQNKVLASGRDAVEVFTLAKKNLGPRKRVEGVYYVPKKGDLFTALCASLISD